MDLRDYVNSLSPAAVDTALRSSLFVEWLYKVAEYKDDDEHNHKIGDSTTSKLHSLLDYIKNTPELKLTEAAQRIMEQTAREPHVFVITYPWYDMFMETLDTDPRNHRFPYRNCVFEYRLFGRHVINVVLADEEGVLLDGGSLMWIETESGQWADLGTVKILCHLIARRTRQTPKEQNDFFLAIQYAIQRQGLAALVALELEAAEEVEHAADAFVNAKRAKKGKFPMCSFHTLRVPERHNRPHTNKPYQGVVRWHYRRGHYTHPWGKADPRKVWRTARWLGNPDLGVVYKHYNVAPSKRQKLQLKMTEGENDD